MKLDHSETTPDNPTPNPLTVGDLDPGTVFAISAVSHQSFVWIRTNGHSDGSVTVVSNDDGTEGAFSSDTTVGAIYPHARIVLGKPIFHPTKGGDS